MCYKELDNKPNLQDIQAEVLSYWDKQDIFQKSVNTGKPEIVFYDGPPFPTGKPHHGTVLVSFIKDMIARYWTMRGYSVPRVWGWDCHGLPIENQAEKLMGITDKNEIENSIGIDKFNDKCFEIVSANNDAWREYVVEMARWVDYDNAYKTMDKNFMESVMWAFKQCYDKGLIYQDYRVTPYCMHCETSLSISDTRESDSTRLRQDRWVIAKFKSDLKVNGKDVYILAWTTTPWTLISNMCLAVGAELEYSFVEVGDAVYVACTATLPKYENIFGETPAVVKTCKGSELVGVNYEPLFPYFADKKEAGAFRVVTADYVGADDGVGVVHTAPAFGEDDYWTCKNYGVPLVNPVDEKGHFTEEVTDFYFADPKDRKNVIEMNGAIIRFLYGQDKVVADGTLEHNYPHCWRCKDPLIYKAMDAWYFSIDKVKDRLLELNEQVNWIPETVKHGRFGNWLKNARDWNISRSRYWSTPIPIWTCECCGERTVMGSIDEIHEKSGVRLENLHRQYMDEVTFTCGKCGGTMHRVPEVLDCWFESGSVPFAEKHYPFENKEWFESHFPSDFVVEYTGQIRCWFYYLHVLAGALFDRPAFKNCVVHGTVLAKDGKKLSKSSKNYTDPMELMKSVGTDPFRLYMYQSPAMLIGDLQFDESGLQESIQKIILPFWNACKFFISYANIDGYHPKMQDVLSRTDLNTQNLLDKWVLAKLYDASSKITDNMDNYYVNHYVDHLLPLIDGLTNWYIRRSRRRFWGVGVNEDKAVAYDTLYYVLVNTCKLLAPVAPVIAEKMYRELTGEESVHLSAWPEIPAGYQDDSLLNSIDTVQNIIYLSRQIRNKNRVKNRQPLSTLKVVLSNQSHTPDIEQFKDVIAEELNVKNISVLTDIGEVATVQYAPNFNEIKNRYPDKMGQLIKLIKSGKFTLTEDAVVLDINGESTAFDKSILFVTYQAKEGVHVASDHGIVVSLDLTVTEDLKREGLAREMVRNIQDARKQAGYEITDRILLEIAGDYPAEWMDYVCKETLSAVSTVADPDHTFTVQNDGGQDITIKMAKQ